MPYGISKSKLNRDSKSSRPSGSQNKKSGTREALEKPQTEWKGK